MYFSDAGKAPLTTRELPFCDQVVAVPKPAAYGPVQMLQGALTRWPLPILNYSSEAMLQALRQVLSTSSYDVVHFDSIHMIRYTDVLGGLPIVYNWHNIESEAMQRYSATVGSSARRWYAQQTARKLAKLERGILDTACGHVVCSEREREQLLQLQPRARIAVVENGVDVSYFSGSGALTPPPPVTGTARLVFVGSMDYFPNVDAATSFVEHIWPRLRLAYPELQLLIVGAKPTAEVLALNGRDGIIVTGTVDDVRPYYGGATAAVVPLRTGGGTRLKILEAMAAGVPVISTPIGAEGLAVTPDHDILLAGPEQADVWLKHLQTLSGAGPQRRQLVANAFDLVERRYDWAQLGRQLGRSYQEWLQIP